MDRKEEIKEKIKWLRNDVDDATNKIRCLNKGIKDANEDINEYRIKVGGYNGKINELEKELETLNKRSKQLVMAGDRVFHNNCEAIVATVEILSQDYKVLIDVKGGHTWGHGMVKVNHYNDPIDLEKLTWDSDKMTIERKC